MLCFSHENFCSFLIVAPFLINCYGDDYFDYHFRNKHPWRTCLFNFYDAKHNNFVLFYLSFLFFISISFISCFIFMLLLFVQSFSPKRKRREYHACTLWKHIRYHLIWDHLCRTVCVCVCVFYFLNVFSITFILQNNNKNSFLFLSFSV